MRLGGRPAGRGSRCREICPGHPKRGRVFEASPGDEHTPLSLRGAQGELLPESFTARNIGLECVLCSFAPALPFTRARPKVSRFRPECGRARPKLGRLHPRLRRVARIWPDVVGVGQESVEPKSDRPNLVTDPELFDIGQVWPKSPKFAQHRPKFGRFRPMFAEIGPKLADVGSHVVQHLSKFGRPRPKIIFRELRPAL